MLNSKFILEDNTDVFPCYLDKEQRKHIKEKYEGRKQFMRCGCKPNGDLWYRISEDLKIYPEHNNYKHDLLCSRYLDENGKKTRQSAYVIDDETGNVTTYLSFDVKEFSLDETTEREQNNDVPEEQENVEEISIEKNDEIKAETRKKEPKLSLKGLIRGINVDTFTEKILTGKNITSQEQFRKMVYYRMKKVGVSKSKRAIGEMTLEKDGVRFFYLPFAGSYMQEIKGYKKCYVQTLGIDGKIYNNFTYPEVLEDAIRRYSEQYAAEPNSDTMVAGFQYLKKSRSGSYRVMGRIHLFETSDMGLYCNNSIEQDAFNMLHNITKDSKDIKFWITPEDASIGAFIEIKGCDKKIILIFREDKTQRIAFDPTLYVPLVVEDGNLLTEEFLREMIHQ